MAESAVNISIRCILSKMTTPSDRGKLSFRQILSSTLAAAFGVQSGNKLKRDFSRGQPVQFIIAGVIFLVVFVVIILTVVNWVVSK